MPSRSIVNHRRRPTDVLSRDFDARFLLARSLRKSVAALLLSSLWIGPPQAQAPASPRSGCSISGVILSGTTPLPGVALTATRDGGEITATATAPTGVYELRVPEAGLYSVRAELAAFAPVTSPVSLSPDQCHGRLDLTMQLASRRAASPAAGATANPTPEAVGRGAAGAGNRTGGRGGAGGRGFQQLDVIANAAGDQAGASADEGAEALRAQLQLPPGFSVDAPTETLATSGNQGQLNQALLFGPGGRDGRPEEFDRFAAEGEPGQRGGGFGGFGGLEGRGAGPGGFGGGPGMLGGLRGGGSGRLQGTANYTLGGSMFDASPYALNGRAAEKPDYVQQRVGTSVGGPLKIPRVYNGGTNTSFFLNYSGNHSRTPTDSYSTVPTLAQRGGDFSASTSAIVDPQTGQRFEDNQIPQSRISPAARALLPFIPEPNLPGTTQNFHYLTAVTSTSDDVNFRLTHVFGAPLPQRGGRGGPGGLGPGGPGRGGGGFAGRAGQGGRGPVRPRSVLNVSASYRRSTSVQSSSFPTIGGATKGNGWNVPVSYMYARGRFNNVLNVNYNRNSTTASNLYAFSTDVVGAAGIKGVSGDPFDWGVPNLSFTSIADLRDRTPSRRVDQRIQISDTMMRIIGTHALRWGGDFRHLTLDSLSNSNPRGSFVFTGLYTSALADGRAVQGTGLDVADFLLGLAQQASVQYGPGEVKLRGKSWNLFVQDDWRVRGNLTLNVGLRYEYVSPYVHAHDRLVNLDVPPDFTAAVPVVSGESGPFSGSLPRSLVAPDRNNLAPRVGIAWKPEQRTTIRTGYGVNYNLGAYGAIAQKLAGQPPFAVSSTAIGTALAPLPLADPFAAVDSSTTSNSYGIDPRYQLGVAQIWNVDVQRDLPRNLTLNVGYTGTRGSSLDIQRAPNRTADGGLRIDGVQPFIWQSSEGRSTLHAFNLRARKRLARGFSFGGGYTWSRAYDNASSIGGGGATVAQDDQDLDAEWGRSSFERRHAVTADYSIELPWGPGRRWLDGNGWRSQFLGGWSWNGSLTAQSGSPFTPRVLGSFTDVSTGVNGTLRADYNGQAIAIDDPTVLRFFNTDAFSIPAAGMFGTAARNSITGPGSYNVNMGLSKNVTFARSRGMSVRIQATNVFNTVQFSSIDTVVNSPTFGQITGVRPMRSVQLVTRFRF